MNYPVDVIWLIAAVWGAGFCFVPRDVYDEGISYASAIAFAIGFVVLAIAVGVAGLTVGYSDAVLTILGLLFSAGVFISVTSFRLLATHGMEFMRKWRWSLVVVCVLPFLQLWSTLGPETFVDSLWYHLAVPKFWLLNGRLADVPFNVPSHYPMLSHLPYVMVLWLDEPWCADVHARLFSVFPMIPLLLGVYGACARHAGPRAGILAAALTGSIAWWPLPAIANIQAIVALMTTLGYTELWRWLETRRTRRLLLSAALMGAACATKLNAVVMGLVPCLLLVGLDAVRSRSIRGLGWVPAYGGLAVAWLVPWWIANAVRRGNPFYPFAEGLFPSPEPYHNAATTLLAQHHIAPVEAGTFDAWLSALVGLGKNLVSNGDVLICLTPFMGIILAVLARRHVHLWVSIPLILIMATTVSGLNAERLVSVSYPALAVLYGVAIVLLVRSFSRYRWLYWIVLLLPVLTTLNVKYWYVTNPGIGWRGRVSVAPFAYSRVLRAESVEYLSILHIEIGQQLQGLLRRQIGEEPLVYAHRAGYPFHIPGRHIVPDFAFDLPLARWLSDGGRELALTRLSALGVNVLYIGSQLDRAEPRELSGLESLLGETPHPRSVYVIEPDGVCRRCWGTAD